MVSQVGKGLFIILLFLLHACDRANNCSNDRGVPVLIFHDIAFESSDVLNTSPDYFCDLIQMIHLAGKQTWFASELVDCLAGNHPLPKNTIVITFDDAWVAMRDTVDPLLKAKGMKATFFVHLSGIEAGRPVRCGWDDLNYLQNSGRWEIHSHSLTHKNLTCLQKNELMKELKKSRKRLHRNGFTKANLLAYPFGAYTVKVKNDAAQAGYSGAFTAGPIPSATSGSDLFAIPRTTGCQVFDQELLCKKMDIDLAAIRDHLAIFDEGEGKFSGTWECCNYVEETGTKCATLGQIGNTYTCTCEPTAVWEMVFAIPQEGMYKFSVWRPVRYKRVLIEDYTIAWAILGRDVNQKGCLEVTDGNQWNDLTSLPLHQGMYKLRISPKEDLNKVFVDAVKVAWGGNDK